MLYLSKISDIPDDINELALLAHEEGFRFLHRLLDDFSSGENRFDRAGEALFEVRNDVALVGIGGLNIDPFAQDARVGRVRRVYVHPQHRGQGMGKLLMHGIESHAARAFHQLHLFTDTHEASLFYQRLGYEAVAGNKDVSHVKYLRA